MKLHLVSSAVTVVACLSPLTSAQGYQHAYQAPLPTVQVQEPPAAPAVGLQIAEQLQLLTGWNTTGMYNRYARSKEFDRALDERDGFVRLTDRNWGSLVKHEQLPEGEKERVWFSIMHAPPSDPTSTAYMEAMTAAARIARSNTTDPLDHVKWGRIDFITEVELAAKWLVFKPPIFVIATNRGSDLRFITPRMVAANGTTLETIMREEHWKNIPVWESDYAPGGSRAFVVDWYVKVVQTWGKITTTIPTWALLILMPMITQQLMSWMHAGSASPAPGATAPAVVPVSGTSAGAPAVILEEEKVGTPKKGKGAGGVKKRK